MMIDKIIMGLEALDKMLPLLERAVTAYEKHVEYMGQTPSPLAITTYEDRFPKPLQEEVSLESLPTEKLKGMVEALGIEVPKGTRKTTLLKHLTKHHSSDDTEESIGEESSPSIDKSEEEPFFTEEVEEPKFEITAEELKSKCFELIKKSNAAEVVGIIKSTCGAGEFKAIKEADYAKVYDAITKKLEGLGK